MAWIDVIVLLAQIFPEEFAPFSIDDGVQALSEAYPELNVNYARVFHTYWNLYNNEHTREIVKPLNEGKRPLLFSAGAMRRIARKFVKSQVPAMMQRDVHLDRRHHTRPKAASKPAPKPKPRPKPTPETPKISGRAARKTPPQCASKSRSKTISKTASKSGKSKNPSQN
jgi:hypothetical protein